MTATESEQLLGVIVGKHGELQAAISETWNVVQGASFLTPRTTVGAWLDAIDQVQRKVNELAPDGRLGRAVLAGELSIQSWRGIHSAQWDLLAYTRREVGLNSISAANLWANVVLPTVSGVTELAGDAADAAKVGLPALGVFVVAVLVLLVVLKVG